MWCSVGTSIERHEQDQVGEVERAHGRLAPGARQVEHHPVEVAAQERDSAPLHVRAAHELGLLGVHRRGEDLHAVAVGPESSVRR